MKDQLLYDIYCRKSQEDEDRQVLSLEAQEKEVKEYAAKNGLKIRKIWRESFSAKAPGRPLFNAMMQDIAEGKVQGIAAWHPDRLGRNSVDGGLVIYYLDQGFLKDLAFPTYHFENNPQGKWMLNIQFGQSKYYVDSLSENVKRGNRLKLEKGWRPNRAPAGYLNERVDKTILADPERFPILQRAFKELIYTQTSVLQVLDKINNEWGYRSMKTKRHGGNPLSRSSIYYVLTNPFYCGIIKYNDKEYPGKHTEMVTEDEFDKLQLILGREGKPRPKTHYFALTGMIRCGECNSMITAETKTKYFRRTNRVATYTYYRCSKKNKKIKCNQLYIQEEQLEGQIDSYLSRITIHEDFTNWALKYLDYLNEHEAKTEEVSFKNIHKQIEDTRSELRNLTRLKIREQVDEDTFEEERLRLEKEIRKLNQLQTETNRQADDWIEVTMHTFNFAYLAKLYFENGDLNLKKEIFAQLGSNFKLKDKKLTLDLDKQYFAFTPEGKEKAKRLGIDQNKLDSLKKVGLQPPEIWMLRD